MDAVQSFEVDPHDVPHQPPVLKRGTGGIYGGEWQPCSSSPQGLVDTHNGLLDTC